MIPEPLVQRVQWACHGCEFKVSAMTERGLKDALDGHAAYVNRATTDRDTDPHFEEHRLDRLIVQ